MSVECFVKEYLTIKKEHDSKQIMPITSERKPGRKKESMQLKLYQKTKWDSNLLHRCIGCIVFFFFFFGLKTADKILYASINKYL